MPAEKKSARGKFEQNRKFREKRSKYRIRQGNHQELRFDFVNKESDDCSKITEQRAHRVSLLRLGQQNPSREIVYYDHNAFIQLPGLHHSDQLIVSWIRIHQINKSSKKYAMNLLLTRLTIIGIHLIPWKHFSPSYHFKLKTASKCWKTLFQRFHFCGSMTSRAGSSELGSAFDFWKV